MIFFAYYLLEYARPRDAPTKSGKEESALDTEQSRLLKNAATKDAPTMSSKEESV